MDFSFFDYGFIQRALVAGIAIGVACSLLGVFLVLRKMSLIGDGLSHVSFGALALGLFFGVYPFFVALPIVLIASYFILQITKKTRISADAAIGMVSALGISLGVVFSSMGNGLNVDVMSYLFGSILSIHVFEVWVALALSLVVIVLILLLYNDLFVATFDEEYAKTLGIRTEVLNILLVGLAALTVLLSVKMVGVMLVSALLIIPAITALHMTKSFRGALFISALFSVLAIIFGIVASFLFNLPTGATIVLASIVLFGGVFVMKRL